MDIESYVQYKAMVICTGMHALLLMFELLACDKLQNDRSQVGIIICLQAACVKFTVLNFK